MSHSNRTSLPEGYLWGWDYTGERRPQGDQLQRLLRALQILQAGTGT